MNVQKDYEELLRLFNANSVRYCLVGAYALAFHVRPRYTKDIDLFVEATVENGKNIINSLEQFGFSDMDLSEKDFAKEGQIIQLGYEPVRIDILTSIDGVMFEDVWKNKIEGKYGSEKVYYISRNDLIKNKEASKRKQDEADLQLLREPE